MNISIDTTPEQDAVIQFKTQQYNATLPKDEAGNPINPLTPRQFAIMGIRSQFVIWKQEFYNYKLENVREKYFSGDDAKRSSIDQAAQ